MEREITGGERRGKNLPPRGVAEDIVEIIRVRHMLEVHGERFISNLSLTVKFITGFGQICSNFIDTFWEENQRTNTQRCKK